MEQFLKDAGKTVLNFAALFILQWFIPYPYLVAGAGGYGLFQLISAKKRSGWHLLIAAVVLGGPLELLARERRLAVEDRLCLEPIIQGIPIHPPSPLVQLVGHPSNAMIEPVVGFVSAVGRRIRRGVPSSHD